MNYIIAATTTENKTSYEWEFCKIICEIPLAHAKDIFSAVVKHADQFPWTIRVSLLDESGNVVDSATVNHRIAERIALWGPFYGRCAMDWDRLWALTWVSV